MKNLLRHNANQQIEAKELFIKFIVDEFNYEFSTENMVYVNSRTPVELECRTHGKFNINPISLKGRKVSYPEYCPKCLIRHKVKERENNFLAAVIKIHKDRYTYSEIIYINTHTKIKVMCKIHGTFEIKPGHLLRGVGCKQCGVYSRIVKTKHLKNDFIKAAENIHSHKFNYDLVDFKSYTEKVEIKCPEHGLFWQVARNHLVGTGCPRCGMDITANARKVTLEDFLRRAIETHGNNYTYEKVNLKSMENKIIITCKVHGDFLQTPISHVTGSGCEKCGFIRTAKALSSNTEEFLSKAEKVHGAKYSYISTEYKRVHDVVSITCKEHGNFNQLAGHHLRGHGCPSCAKYGFDKSKPAMLYYFKITDGVNVAWKIGITNRSIEERYTKEELSRMSEIQERWYEDGQECYDMEQKMLQKYKQYKYNGPGLLLNGNTELFGENIFKKE